MDPLNRVTKFKYNKQGKVIEVISGLKLKVNNSKEEFKTEVINANKETFNYNSEGRIKSAITSFGDTYDYEYSKGGHITKLSLNSIPLFEAKYSKSDKLKFVRFSDGNQYKYKYFGNSTIIIKKINFCTSKYTFSKKKLISSESCDSKKLNYKYDAKGNLKSIKKNGKSIFSVQRNLKAKSVSFQGVAGIKIKYQYDSKGRLVSIGYK